MKLNYLTAIGVLAALMTLSGCSDQDAQSVGEALPSPSGSTDAPGNSEPSPQADDGVVSPEEAEQSEFAALDTNSNGTLEESEWESDETRNIVDLKNMTFAQIDRNSSGGIELEEFRNASTDGDVEADTRTGTDTAVRNPSAEETDPSKP